MSGSVHGRSITYGRRVHYAYDLEKEAVIRAFCYLHYKMGRSVQDIQDSRTLARLVRQRLTYPSKPIAEKPTTTC